MDEKTKKILIYSSIGVGVIVLFYAGSIVLTKITQKLGELKNQNNNASNGGNNPPAPPEIQPTISGDQANSIANSVFEQIDDANFITGVDETIELLSPIKNQKDWDLVKNAYGVRVKINFGIANNYTGDLPGTLNDEYGDDSEDIGKLRNFFATKGITGAL